MTIQPPDPQFFIGKRPAISQGKIAIEIKHLTFEQERGFPDQLIVQKIGLPKDEAGHSCPEFDSISYNSTQTLSL